MTDVQTPESEDQLKHVRRQAWLLESLCSGQKVKYTQNSIIIPYNYERPSHIHATPLSPLVFGCTETQSQTSLDKRVEHAVSHQKLKPRSMSH